MNMWEERVKKQSEDLKTNKVRDDLKISLTDLEYKELKGLAYEAGFKNAGALLSSLVGDLTGWHSNGSDERDRAEQWYERAFGRWEGYFRYHLYIYENDLDAMNDMIEDPEYFEEVYGAYQAENKGKYIESKEDCLKLLRELIHDGTEL